MRIRIFLTLSLALLLLAPAGADAAASKHLWATVNVCDTEAAPNTIGVRARMPGNGTHQRMWMRYRIQFYSDADSRWKYVAKGGASPWVEAGSALFAFKETGYEFEFDPPAAGQRFLLRGVVDYQWRQRKRTKSGRVVTLVRKSKRKYTAGGHRTRGADPADYTAARCEIAA
jgi:hypothetical protein